MSEQKKTRTRKKKKTGLADSFKSFSQFEVLFVIVLFLGFIAWGFSKCSNSMRPSNTNPPPAPLSDEQTDDENFSPAASNNPNSPTYDLGETNESNTPAPTTSVPSSGNVEVVGRNNEPSTSRRGYTPLYVTLQDLKVRRGPSRDSSIIAVLNLNEEVMFMEKRTNFSEKINIGNQTTDEPWIYIQTQKGQKGWVYGAGVHYFKWDRLKDPIRSIGLEDEESDEIE